MTDQFRAMCAELVEAMTDDSTGCWQREADVIDRARALLAQAVAGEPTDEDVTLTYAYAVATAVGNKRGPFKPEDAEAAQLAGLRAVLAKWGHPTPQPVAVSERLQAVEALAADAVSGLRYIEQTHGRLYGVGWDRVFDAAAKFLPANALPTPEANVYGIG